MLNVWTVNCAILRQDTKLCPANGVPSLIVFTTKLNIRRKKRRKKYQQFPPPLEDTKSEMMKE